MTYEQRAIEAANKIPHSDTGRGLFGIIYALLAIASAVQSLHRE